MASRDLALGNISQRNLFRPPSLSVPSNTRGYAAPPQPPEYVQHIATACAHKIVTDPKRLQYQEEARAKREDAMYLIQMHAHNSYSATDDTYLREEGAKAREQRDTDKEATRAISPDWLNRCIEKREPPQRSLDDRHAAEIIESSTRTNPNPLAFFTRQIADAFPTLTSEHQQAAIKYANTPSGEGSGGSASSSSGSNSGGGGGSASSSTSSGSSVASTNSTSASSTSGSSSTTG
jgi:hypothetical protein